MSFGITSAAFGHNAKIPAKFTCDGEDVSPALSWSGAPKETKSFALICDDPDAPVGTWVHWIIFNIPADTTILPENLPKTEILPGGARHGASWGR